MFTLGRERKVDAGVQQQERKGAAGTFTLTAGGGRRPPHELSLSPSVVDAGGLRGAADVGWPRDSANSPGSLTLRHPLLFLPLIRFSLFF